ncbi:hypothetical protein MRB53_039106 [Persea americana]|nr:hypothetical protein MRB53_039106 [Persea americana]
MDMHVCCCWELEAVEALQGVVGRHGGSWICNSFSPTGSDRRWMAGESPPDGHSCARNLQLDLQLNRPSISRIRLTAQVARNRARAIHVVDRRSSLVCMASFSLTSADYIILSQPDVGPSADIIAHHPAVTPVRGGGCGRAKAPSSASGRFYLSNAAGVSELLSELFPCHSPGIVKMGAQYVDGNARLLHRLQKLINPSAKSSCSAPAQQKLGEGLQHASAISLDVNDPAALEAEVAKNDLVISLIPYTFHAQVIKAAIATKKHCVTTSYVSEAMMALDEEAKKAGITVFNEIGLDPGVDHLYAVKTISEVHAQGGKSTDFWSYCGGLPAPENSDNPLGYKFSWSPRGVLLAASNTAHVYQGGKKVTVTGAELMSTAKPYYIYPGYAFEAYPNRDSTPFRERYAIPEAQTVIRGTLRYQGNPAFVQTLQDLGLLSTVEHDFLQSSQPALSWREAFAKIIRATSSSDHDLVWAVSSKAKFQSTEDKDRILAGLRWIGLFSDAPAQLRGTPLDTLCATLEHKMHYTPGERDFVMLQHKFGIEWADGRRETRTSTLCEYGAPEGSGGYSAMAKLVGVPCAVAVLMVLNNEISARGILAPVTPELAEPIRRKLQESYGIELQEKTLA